MGRKKASKIKIVQLQYVSYGVVIENYYFFIIISFSFFLRDIK